MGRPRKHEARMMVATEDYMTRDATIHAGITFLREDDPIVKAHPQFFKVSEQHSRPPVEQATNAPGEERA